MATGLPYFNVVVDKFGNAIPNAQVAVLSGFGANTGTQPGSPLASIFSDVNLTIPISNPINTDALGRFQFFAQTGNYLIQIYSNLNPPLIAQYVISVTLSGPSVLSVAGTANQITVTNGLVNAVVSLPSTLIAPGTLEVALGSLKLDGSTSGSATIQAKAAAGTPNALQLPLATGGAGTFLQTDGGNPQQLSWATPTSGLVVQQFNSVTLSSNVGPITKGVPTTVLTKQVTMPSSGGPWRIFINYTVWTTFNVDDNAMVFWVSDGTTTMASLEYGQSNASNGGRNGGTYGGFSPGTYANSAVVTFTLIAECTNANGGGGPTVLAAPDIGSGPNSNMQLIPMTSV